MSASHSHCPKCGSEKIIPRVHLKDRTDHSMDYRLSAVVDEHPNALLFKGPHETKLQANICGDCGYAELFAESPRDLWDAYQRRLANLKKK